MDDEFDTFAQQHDQRSRDSRLQPRVALATIEQIRYAEQLRLHIRESYLSRRAPPPSVWMTGVD